jgi:uncharacterized membrane protein
MPVLSLLLAVVFDLLALAAVVVGYGSIRWPQGNLGEFFLPLIPALLAVIFSTASVRKFRGDSAILNRFVSKASVGTAFITLALAVYLPVANYRAMEETRDSIRQRLE